MSRPLPPLGQREAEAAPPPEASHRYAYRSLEGDAAGVALADECALAIAYNGLSQAVMMVTPADLEDFVVGFSLTSGTVQSLDEIFDLRLAGTGDSREAQVEIANRAFWSLKQQRRQLAGTSGCGLCGVEALHQALPELPTLAPAPLPPAAWLDGLRERIAVFQPLGRHCGAVHAAVFMDARGELRLGREDIGRHNALDKLIGALARTRLDTRDGVAVVTSRCSLELIHKVLRAGIGTLVSLSAPTGLAVDWARRHRLNLIHLPHRSGPRLFSPVPDTESLP
ncbi:formate dehydrogenase accessory sulfurtransferase FdhD [Stutzerimonas azotifigens]|uniref:formate dehydrogenase accessory sulfurtransferase FdhD n=1 Tax=Stutzerimonas azotifigens TaxID=291995 RepID=UPI000407F176|nr:formate dehydrogenase accessory sulfurtransferase FdhD [Stutzerimonas azotifigens]